MEMKRDGPNAVSCRCAGHPAARRHFVLGSMAALLLSACAGARQAPLANLRVNGEPVTGAYRARPGDIVATSPDASASFAVGEDAFLLRAGSEMELYGAARVPPGTVSGINLMSGAVYAAFGSGQRDVVTTTATATCVDAVTYVETQPELTYLCICRGTAALRDAHRSRSHAVYAEHHSPWIIRAEANAGDIIQPAALGRHTDEELAALKALARPA